MVEHVLFNYYFLYYTLLRALLRLTTLFSHFWLPFNIRAFSSGLSLYILRQSCSLIKHQYTRVGQMETPMSLKSERTCRGFLGFIGHFNDWVAQWLLLTDILRLDIYKKILCPFTMSPKLSRNIFLKLCLVCKDSYREFTIFFIFEERFYVTLCIIEFWLRIKLSMKL